jgi:hypothetical protein
MNVEGQDGQSQSNDEERGEHDACDWRDGGQRRTCLPARRRHERAHAEPAFAATPSPGVTLTVAERARALIIEAR